MRIYICIYVYIYKRASLACAARLADTLCPPEAPFGRLGSHWLIIREITLITVTTGAHRAPPVDTKCPPAAQRKQAKRACIYIYIYIFTHNKQIKTCNHILYEYNNIHSDFHYINMF